jgi:hypothetical protein
MYEHMCRSAPEIRERGVEDLRRVLVDVQETVSSPDNFELPQ